MRTRYGRAAVRAPAVGPETISRSETKTCRYSKRRKPSGETKVTEGGNGVGREGTGEERGWEEKGGEGFEHECFVVESGRAGAEPFIECFVGCDAFKAVNLKILSL